MIVAAVMNANNEITPIVEGEIIRLYNLITKKYTDYTNPATTLTEGRRGATLKFAKEHGATAFVTPPETFCELSYAKAKQDGIGFYRISKHITFEEFQARIDDNQLQADNKLPDKEIVPSFVPNR